jgi:hypothetical protein
MENKWKPAHDTISIRIWHHPKNHKLTFISIEDGCGLEFSDSGRKIVINDERR